MADASGDTPSHELPAVARTIMDNNPLTIVMQSVLQELKNLGRKVETLTATVNAHVTDNAIFRMRFEDVEKDIDSLRARVTSLEHERDELTKSVLAKAITLVLVLSGLVAAAAWLITKKAGT